MALDAPPLEDQPQRILIIDTAWIGDVVFSTALINATRRLYPTAQLHVLVARRGVDILRGHPLVDKLIVLEKRGWRGQTTTLFDTCRALRSEHYDLVLNTHPSFRSRLITLATAARVRVGYSGFLSGLCHTQVVDLDLAGEPDHARRRLALLGDSVASSESNALFVPVDRESDAEAERQLQTNHRAPFLGIVIGSAWATKRWPRENFLDIAQRWRDATGGTAIAFGGKSEVNDVLALTQSAGGAVAGMIDIPLRGVAALLKRCVVVVGNDSGISYLACAVQRPVTIVIYGSTQVNYQFTPPHRAIHAGVPCCLSRYGHGAQRCKWQSAPWCMEQVTVDRVWSAVETALVDMEGRMLP